MINDDTIKLLREDNAGVKMAVSSIREVLPNVKSENLKCRLLDYQQEYERLGDETDCILHEYHDTGKEPSPISKGMSWFKTNAKLAAHPTDRAVADLITDGCNMAVKSLNRYLNQYRTADEQSKNITSQLIHSSEQLSTELRAYL